MILVWDEAGITDFTDDEYSAFAWLLRPHSVMFVPDEREDA